MIFWKSLHGALGTKLKFSTAFHPKIDRQSERTFQTLEDMPRACMIDFKNLWQMHLLLVEFAYNIRFQATIDMSPYEPLYGRKCRSLVHWDEVGERKLIGLEILQQTQNVVGKIRERIKTTQD